MIVRYLLANVGIIKNVKNAGNYKQKTSKMPEIASKKRQKCRKLKSLSLTLPAEDALRLLARPAKGHFVWQGLPFGWGFGRPSSASIWVWRVPVQPCVVEMSLS